MKSPERVANHKKKGFVLIAFTLSLVLLLAAAGAAALATPKQWDFGTRAFDPSRTTVEFARTFAGPWSQTPNPATD